MNSIVTSGEKLTTQQAADYLGMRKQTLDLWRSSGRNQIPYFKLGRAVRYLRSDLDAFLATCRMTAVPRGADAK